MIFQRPFLLPFIAATFALGFAFTAQYVFDLWPCVLCIYQRWPYAVVIIACLLAMAVSNSPNLQKALMIVVGLAFLATSGVGGFHVGVEQGWWEGTAECVGDMSAVTNLEALRAQIETAPVVRCSDIAWSMFGISMAGYNFAIALILSLLSFSSLSRISAKPRQL